MVRSVVHPSALCITVGCIEICEMGISYIVALDCPIRVDDPLFDDKIGSCTFKLDEMDLTEEPQEAMKIVDNNIFSEVRRSNCHWRK